MFREIIFDILYSIKFAKINFLKNFSKQINAFVSIEMRNSEYIDVFFNTNFVLSIFTSTLQIIYEIFENQIVDYVVFDSIIIIKIDNFVEAENNDEIETNNEIDIYVEIEIIVQNRSIVKSEFVSKIEFFENVDVVLSIIFRIFIFIY